MHPNNGKSTKRRCRTPANHSKDELSSDGAGSSLRRNPGWRKQASEMPLGNTGTTSCFTPKPTSAPNGSKPSVAPWPAKDHSWEDHAPNKLRLIQPFPLIWPNYETCTWTSESRCISFALHGYKSYDLSLTLSPPGIKESMATLSVN